VGVVIVGEAVDCGLEVGDGPENAPLEAGLCEDGEEALDGIEPGRRGRREVEGPSWMARQPAADDGGVIVEDCVDGVAGGNFALDCIEKADELLVTMVLHVPPDHGCVEDVHRREQGRRSMSVCVWIWLFSSTDRTTA
jgi:hypothetical protein